MKVYTIEKCGECPSYIADHGAYYDEFGVCGRDRRIKVQDNQSPPPACPLKDWEAQPLEICEGLVAWREAEFMPNGAGRLETIITKARAVIERGTP